MWQWDYLEVKSFQIKYLALLKLEEWGIAIIITYVNTVEFLDLQTNGLKTH